MGAAFSNSSSLHDVEEILLLIADGIFFYYVWGVVALTVDVEGGGVWFDVRFINVIFKVHGNVKEVNFCLVWFNCYL